MSNVKQDFKESTGLIKWVKWLIYAQIVVTIIAMASGFLEYQFFSDFKNGVFPSQESAISAAEASDFRQGAIGIVQMIMYIVAGIMILKWIYRSNYNARQLGAENMHFTPGWSVGWYFIPIVNLWKPYKAMREIWKASAKPEAWGAQSVSLLLPFWWFFWIASSILGNLSFRLAVRAENIDELVSANIVAQLSDASVIPLSIIFIIMADKIHEMQMSHARVEQVI